MDFVGKMTPELSGGWFFDEFWEWVKSYGELLFKHINELEWGTTHGRKSAFCRVDLGRTLCKIEAVWSILQTFELTDLRQFFFIQSKSVQLTVGGSVPVNILSFTFPKLNIFSEKNLSE